MADQPSIANALQMKPTFELTPANAPANVAQTPMQPMAQALQAQGRNNDTMLVHMTPGEVSGLNALAMQTAGQPLTINPATGLPEAGLLENLLPTIAGIGLSMIPGVGPLMAAGIVGGGTALMTGDLGKGLMAGLGAYGGANLGGALSGAGAAAETTAAANTLQAGATGLEAQAASDVLARNAASYFPSAAESVVGGVPAATLGTPAQAAIAQGIAQPSANLAMQGVKGLGTSQGWSNLAEAGKQVWANQGTLGKVATGLGAANTFGAFEQPTFQPMVTPEDEYQMNYEGPYLPTQRQVSFRPAGSRDTSEYTYFTPSNPVPYAEGGETEDRAIKFAGADYQGGVDPEFGHGFKPVQVQGVDFGGNVASASNAVPAFFSGKGGKMEVANPVLGYTSSGEKIYQYSSQDDFLENNPLGPLALHPIGAVFTRGSYGERAPSSGKGGMMSSLGSAVRKVSDSDADLSSYNRLEDLQYNPMTQRMERMADGGEVRMEDGGFVMDARSVSEIGNGSSNAGLEKLSKLGARPLQGRGDGVSDSIPANIGGSQKARVARDEAYFSPEAVEKLGGSQKLYAMMDKAHKSRKNAKRGQDTGGLKALMA